MSQPLRLLPLLLALAFCLAPALAPRPAHAAASNSATTKRDTVTLVSQTNSPANGTLTMALEFQLQPGWHIYWSNPGDAGLPPTITLAAPASAGPLSFPAPEFLLQPPVGAYVLSGHVLLPFQASNLNANASPLSATASWLVCSDICVPEHASFTLPLNTPGPSAEAGLFTPSTIAPSPFPASISANGTLSLTGPTAAQVKSARFFPNSPTALVNAAPQPLAFTATGLTLKLTLAPPTTPGAKPAPLTGLLELTDQSGAMQALNLTATPAATAQSASPLLWLAAAFLGGLILNLMPCVFPILAIKALAIARLGGEAQSKVRADALGYSAGVLVAFAGLGALLLALRALGAEIGWGFQLQSPYFVAAMALLMLAIALNLAGAFEITGLSNFGNALAARSSFFTGLLAVAVATPCTAPFMGGAIAAALAAPAYLALAIFLALGLGLAAPFLLFAAFPNAASLLPRPGAWMLWLQRVLSLPMFATFGWLVWVFASQLNLAAAAPLLPGAEPFSTARLAQYRATHTPVLVDVTAAWCVTCLVNEHSSLTNISVQQSLTAHGVKLLVADWTTRSPAITGFLQSNGRDGVPLYLYYPASGTPPVTLPQILTPQIVLNALK